MKPWLYIDPWSLSALLGAVVIYPLLVWRDGGFRNVAGFWLEGGDFSTPEGAFAAMYLAQPKPPRSWVMVVVGNIFALNITVIASFMILSLPVIVIYGMLGWSGRR